MYYRKLVFTGGHPPKFSPSAMLLNLICCGSCSVEGGVGILISRQEWGGRKVELGRVPSLRGRINIKHEQSWKPKIIYSFFCRWDSSFKGNSWTSDKCIWATKWRRRWVKEWLTQQQKYFPVTYTGWGAAAIWLIVSAALEGMDEKSGQIL